MEPKYGVQKSHNGAIWLPTNLLAHPFCYKKIKAHMTYLYGSEFRLVFPLLYFK